MNGFKGQFTRVKNISDIRRLPIRDKIRLGIKVISPKTNKEYPKETDYFVCPLEVQKVYGEKPKELEIRFPINDLEVIFPQSYIWWGQSKGAKCRGNGERALRLNEETGEMEDRECPCEKLDENKCQLRAQLRFFLEKVSLGELFAINLGSFHSIVDINSSLEFIQALVGKFSMIPLKLKRVPKETHGSGHKEIHFTLKAVLESNDIEYLNKIREGTKYLPEPKFLLPAPIFENPALDEGAVVEVEEEDQGVSDSKEGISKAMPPPKDIISPIKDAKQEGEITEEEATQALKDAGMVDNDKSEKSKDEKLEEAKLLNQFVLEIAKFRKKKDLMEWYGKNKEDFRKRYSNTIFEELREMVNDKLKKLKE